MDALRQCPACRFESDSFPDLSCPQCGEKFTRSGVFSPWPVGLALAVLLTGFMLAFHFSRPIILLSGLASFLFSVLGLRRRLSLSASGKSSPRPLASQPVSVTLLNITIAILGLAFLCCLLFGFVSAMNAHIAVERVEGQPYHATTFQVIRPYYQKSDGSHSMVVSVYASGMVEDKKEWMDLSLHLKRSVRNQSELNDLVPPGTVIPVYLFPNLKGQSRIQLIDVLPPGEASRRTEMWVLRRAPVALVALGALILLSLRIRRSRILLPAP